MAAAMRLLSANLEQIFHHITDPSWLWISLTCDEPRLKIQTVHYYCEARRLGSWWWCLIVSWWANNEIHFNYTQPQLHTILICLSWDMKFWAMMTELRLKNCIINALFAVFIQISHTQIMITVVKKYVSMWKWHQPASPHEEDWCHHLTIVQCLQVPAAARRPGVKTGTMLTAQTWSDLTCNPHPGTLALLPCRLCVLLIYLRK